MLALMDHVLTLLLGGIVTAFWVWMLFDAAMHEPATGNSKLLWVLIILLAACVGAAIYFLCRRPQRIAETRRASRRTEPARAVIRSLPHPQR
jgi:hypothetical protein